MKSLELKVVKENVMGNEIFLTTYGLLKSVINQPEQGGFSVEDMMKRLKLLNKIEEHKEIFDKKEEFKDSDLETKSVIEFEDADFAFLKELFKKMKWGVISTTIVSLSEEIDKL